MTHFLPDRARTAAALVAAALVAAGCSSDTTGPQAAAIHLLPQQLWLRPGDSVQLTATAVTSDSAQLSATITFSVSDTTIALVTPSGLLHARHKIGHATVTASGAGTQVQEPLIVTGTPFGVAVTPATTTLTEGASVQLSAYVHDSLNDTVPYRTITFSSGDTTIVRVTPAGLATGVGAGGPVYVLAASGLLGGNAQLFVRDSNLLANVPVAAAPYFVRVSAAGLAYVTSISDGIVHRITVSTGALADSIRFGVNAVQVAISAGGDTSYVTDRSTGKIYALEWSGHHAIDSITTGTDLYALAIDHSGNAYVGTGGGSAVYKYSLTSHAKLDSASVGPSTQIALGPGDSLLYVSSTVASDIVVVRTSDMLTVATFLPGAAGKPQQSVTSQDGSELYVADEFGNLRILSTMTGLQVDSVVTGGGTFGVALSSDGATLYVGTTAGKIFVINRATRAVKHVVLVGGTPRCLAVDPVSGRAVVANEGSNEVEIVR
ncbi:MAG TPA: Ig-like domain-containing protein [Gemmatimonadales bacterium]|jgi:hypothetical protein|nr:Ig-like domain-containing protein [Gemmatimonadales bacterium]